MPNSVSDVKLTHRIAGQCTALMLRPYIGSLDCRMICYDNSANPKSVEYDEHSVFTFWHEYILLMLPKFGFTPMTALCSMHRDGEWVNQTAISLGLNVVRGSTSRGGAAAIRQLRKSIKYSSIVITPDGPRGPRRQMAPGAIFLASRLQCPLVTGGVGVTNCYRLNTWDRFAIPKPTSRVRIVLGPKIRIPKKAGRDELEDFRLAAEKLQNELTAEAQAWADSGKTIEGEMRVTNKRSSKRQVFDKAKPAACILGEGATTPTSPRTKAA